MKSVLTALSLALSLASPAVAGDSWLTSIEAARKKAAAENKLLFVDLYADWCGWCKKLDAQVFSTPRFREHTAGFVLLRVDVEDQAEGSRLQQRFAAHSLPTTLILEADLSPVGRIDGFLPLASFLAALDQVIAEHQGLVGRFELALKGKNTREARELAELMAARSDGRRAAAAYARLLAIGGLAGAERGRIQYQQANSLRLAESFQRAEEVVAGARRDAEGRGDRTLIEALDLLGSLIAQDRGDCKTAMASLQTFIKSYPSSVNQSYARRTLRSLQSSGTCS